MLSVVITSFNRAHPVLRSIGSALKFAATFSDAEVLIIDDASNDQTHELIAQEFGSELCEGTLRYARNPINLGVTGSKNVGYLMAKSKWVGFLDSDDVLLEASADSCRAALEDYPDTPIIFFRCVDVRGRLVGRAFARDHVLDLRTYVQHVSYGEAFTVVNKSKVQVEPYIAELRGYEGLGCARIIREHGPTILAAACLRVYDQRGTNRLSSLRVMLGRWPLVARGHRMMVKEFGEQMSTRQRRSLATKSLVYDWIGRLYSELGPLSCDRIS